MGSRLMPLILNGPISPGRAHEGDWRPPASRVPNYSTSEGIYIGIVNNMPDAALVDTENQFLALLEAAAGDLPVHVGLYSLPEIVRADQAQQHIRDFYCKFRDLPGHQLDALIITGTEPREPDLRKEPYWRTLADLLDWAERETASAVLSCLAAHASVLHSDGIERRGLSEKRFGIFDERKICDHSVTADFSEVIRIPHSRWNELREEELVSCGYVVLTKSQEEGVGLFAKQKRKSLFIHCQGHPEYAKHTLLKEYRRDIKRFIRGERETYPSMPKDYFNTHVTELLTAYREQVLADPREELLSFFPYDVIAETLQNGWHTAGIRLYRNWLEHVRSRKRQAKTCPVTTAVYERAHRTRSATH